MWKCHISPFLGGKVGLGFLGEQGAESIHRRFNALRRNYVTIPNRVTRLEAIMKEHFNQILPQNKAKTPVIVRKPRHKNK